MPSNSSSNMVIRDSGGRIMIAASLRALLLHRAVVRASLAALVVLVAGALHVTDSSRIQLSLEMKSTTGNGGEVFYSVTGIAYSQDRSERFRVIGDGQWHTYTVSLPHGQPIDRVRIDPSVGTGDVAVRLVGLEEDGDVQQLMDSAVGDALGIVHHMRALPKRQTYLRLVSEGGDPYFEIRMPRRMGDFSSAARTRDLAVRVLATFLTWLLLEFLLVWLAGRTRLPPPVLRFTERVSGFVSDDEILRVDGRMLLVFAGIALSALCYVVLGLNQSSMGVWETAYPNRAVEQAIDLGTAKRVRSDEWRVQTPWVLNQVMNGSPTRNENVGGETAPLLASVPVGNAIGIPQLKYAGFRFLDIDRGVSWWWAYKSFALLLSFFWLLLILTRGNLAASLLGTGWIYFSSYTQWWFSSNLPEIMTAFALGVTGAIYALFSARRRLIAAGCVLLFYAAANLALNLYPPFIVPLAYLGLAILGGYLIANRRPRLFLHIRFRTLALLVTAMVIAVYGYTFVAMASDSIHAALATVYPGRRISESGGVPVLKGFYGFFEVFRLGERHLPLMPTNASEASSFVLLWPMILLLIPLRAMPYRDYALLIAFAGFCVLASVWMMCPLPAQLEWLMQKAGWSLVTPKRTTLGLGVGSILACMVLFARIRQQGELAGHSLAPRLVIAAVSIGVLAFGWKLRQTDLAFFSWKVVLIGSTACSLVAAGMALGRTRLLAAGLAIYALPTFGINPLVSGISAISQKPILLAAENQGNQPGDKWMVVGDNNFAQGLKAHGLDVFAGAQYLPDRKSLSILDPSGRYQDIWNRYAIIRVISKPDHQMAQFRKIRGDQYSITLNVCGAQSQRLGITHVAYTGNVPVEDLACLSPLSAPEDSGVRLFKLKH